MAFSPDGSRIVTGGSDKSVRFRDAHTGQEVGPPLSFQGAVQHVAFTRDGNPIVSVSGNTVQVFDANPDAALFTELGGSRGAQLAPVQSGFAS